MARADPAAAARAAMPERYGPPRPGAGSRSSPRRAGRASPGWRWLVWAALAHATPDVSAAMSRLRRRLGARAPTCTARGATAGSSGAVRCERLRAGARTRPIVGEQQRRRLGRPATVRVTVTIDDRDRHRARGRRTGRSLRDRAYSTDLRWPGSLASACTRRLPPRRAACLHAHPVHARGASAVTQPTERERHLAHPGGLRPPAGGAGAPQGSRPRRDRPRGSPRPATRATSARTAATTPPSEEQSKAEAASASSRTCCAGPRSARRPPTAGRGARHGRHDPLRRRRPTPRRSCSARARCCARRQVDARGLLAAEPARLGHRRQEARRHGQYTAPNGATSRSRSSPPSPSPADRDGIGPRFAGVGCGPMRSTRPTGGS